MKKAFKNIKKKVTKKDDSKRRSASPSGSQASRKPSVASILAPKALRRGSSSAASSGSALDAKPTSASNLHLAVWNEELDKVH